MTLKELVRNSNLTVEELAERSNLNYHLAYYYYYKDVNANTLKLTNVVKLCKALDITVDKFTELLEVS